MVRRHNNQLPDNLPQLQNLIKRDPASYKEEFEQQYRHYLNTVEVFCLNPAQPNKSLDELVMFLSQVAACYPDRLSDFPQQLMGLLQAHSTALEPSMRLAFCRALVLMRNKNLLAPTALLELFFELLRCQDRALRQFLQTHIITDITATNAKHKNAKLNTALQNFMFSMLKDSNQRAAKMSLDIMAELYKKNVWNDTKTVNVMATACFSKHMKVTVTALKFFLGSDDPDKTNEDSDSDDEPTIKEVSMANKVNKKSRKRDKQLEKVKKLVVKNQKKKSRAPVFNFSALHLVYDPQGMAERLMKLLEGSNKRFEVKLMILDVISRLIGLHELFLFNYYPYIQRFMQPHQREVTRILQFAAQSSHPLIPPDVVEPLLKTLVDNFVTERNSSDAMAIGLNAVREVCARCPLAMSADLLQDLAMYKGYRDRAVMMAARSLIQLFRRERPELLHRRDRGRPTEAGDEQRASLYGEMRAPDHVPGAEAILQDNDSSEIDIGSGTDSDDDQWLNVDHSDNDEEQKSSDDESEEELDESVESKGDGGERKILKAKRTKDVAEATNKKLLAKQVVLDRILTDEDFRKIEVANARRQVQGAKKGTKRKLGEEEKNKPGPGELVRLADIENIYKKRKHDKQTRMATVVAGQEDREKFGYKDGRMNEHCSRTNREKRKNKNFLMLKHKARGKVKRSFKDKQIALRNHLVKQKRMK